MESENEERPLLIPLTEVPRRKRLCRRIPCEVVLTGAILGLFLFVVTLLIVLENLKASSTDGLIIPNEESDSYSKDNQKLLSQSWQSANSIKQPMHLLKKSKYTSEEATEDEISSNEKENLLKKSKYTSKDYTESEISPKKEKYPSKKYKEPTIKIEKNRKQYEYSTETYEQSVNDSEDFFEMISKILKIKLNFVKKWIKKGKKNFTEDETEATTPEINQADKEQHIIESIFDRFEDSDEERILDDLLEILANTSDKKTTNRNLLGSPMSYNKKAFDKTWQEKKEKYTKTQKEFNRYKWDNVYKGWKEVSEKNQFQKSPNTAEELKLLGSPFKYNKKSIENSRKDIEFINSKSHIDNYKWDTVNKGWKKLSKTGVQNSNRDTINTWKGFLLKLGMNSNNNLKNFKDDCMDSSDGSVPVPYAQGCPFRSTEPGTSDSEFQSQIDCAIIAEEMKRDYGKCIDLSFLPRECKPTWRQKCFSTYQYRKIDGTCNNQIHPTWGKSGIPYVRMVAPDYGDGVSTLRTTKEGTELPNARFLSQKLYAKRMKQDTDATLLFLFFGLFIDHDMAETSIETGSYKCCDQRFNEHPEWRPKECLQIEVSPDDSFYGPKNVKCLDLVRSTAVQGACIGRREQLNKATSFLDGSVVYGATIEKSKKLRQFSNGQLKTQMINHTPFMMYVEGESYKCGTPSEPLKCFEAGDSRVNMLTDLAAIHTLWYREHNRLAKELHKRNPQWSDETLYQEARRIVIAEIQNIAYQEFLPHLLGDEAMDYFDLKVDESKEYNGYDDTIDPSVFNVFAAAAYRFGHSLVQDVLTLIVADNTTKVNIPLHETFFNSQLLHHSGLDMLLSGAASQKIHSVDSFISEEIRNHLFQPNNRDYGHDLAAVGIQRGRDHGLPAYTVWRSVCGLPEIQSWGDLNYVMLPERVQNLQEVYKSFEDIDLIPAALAENPVKGSLLGPTYLCIIGRQFRKTRKGDRFWYEMQGKIGSFTKDQLNAVYKSNMARIVCDNSDNIEKIQKNVFRASSAKNPFVDCDSLPSVDLSLWKV